MWRNFAMTYKNRAELKYLLRWDQYKKIKNELEPYLLIDKNVSKQGKYQVRSLYYDSPNRKMFFEKIDGYDLRYKLRLRTYIKDGKEGKSFFEIKKRLGTIIIKSRINMGLEEAKKFLENPTNFSLEKFSKDDQRVLKNIAFLKYYYNLKPMVTISYYRQPYGIKYASNVRVNFDTFVKFINEFKPSNGIRNGFVLNPNWVIMEIKHCGFFPKWLLEIIQRYNLQAMTYSKYCEGIIKVRGTA